MFTKDIFEEAIRNNYTMAGAAASLKIHFSTFKRYALKYGLYAPNQGGKGKNKTRTEGKGKIPLNDILNGQYPEYQTFKLKMRLYAENIKRNKCEECGVEEWNGKPIECELDHIDGNRTNHMLNNLKILCPNCHSQTETFRFKRGKGA